MPPDDFLNSMTFANGEIGCDCDECGPGAPLPAPIAAALRRRQQQRFESFPLRRTQDRSLMIREGPLAVWKTTMPIDAEPLVEFGSSHRLICIKSLSPESRLRSIGEGIIGASDEEKSRTDLDDWTQGNMYFVYSTGGKAVGWTHNFKQNDEEKRTGPHAVLQIAKIPQNSLDGTQTEVGSSWSSIFIKLSRKALQNKSAESQKYYKFPEIDCVILKKAFAEVRHKENKSMNLTFMKAVPSSDPAPVETL